MSFVYVYLSLLVSVLTSGASAGCASTSSFDEPTILDIWLSKKETLLTVEIESGKNDYCRTCDLKTKKIGFLDISCDTETYEWQDIEKTAHFEFTHVLDKFWGNFADRVNESEFEITFPELVHGDQFNWFYSQALDTLFVLALDLSAYNETEALENNQTIDDFVDSFAEITADSLNVFFVAFNPMTPMDQTKDQYGVAVKPWAEVFDSAAEMVKKPMTVFDTVLSTTQMVSVEEVFAFQMPVIVGECDYFPWFSFDSVDLYTPVSNGSDFDISFKYIGEGYQKSDDRIVRIYGHDERNIWWYDMQGINGEGSAGEIVFSSQQLTNWAMLIFVLIGILFCCVCLSCCICFCRRRQSKQKLKRAHFTADV